MQTESNAPVEVITTTAACDLGRHTSCRSVVFSLTSSHLSDCTCGCHVEPEPVDGDELERIAEVEADRALEYRLELEHFGDYGYDDDDGGRWS